MQTRKKVLWSIFLLFCFALIGVYAAVSSAAASLGAGSRGTKVTEVQTRLKQWGYYDGPVDGKYGQLTINAVKKFQKKHGLAQTGIVNDSTAEKIGISLSSGSNSNYQSSGGSTASGDTYLLARCIYGEARGEPIRARSPWARSSSTGCAARSSPTASRASSISPAPSPWYPMGRSTSPRTRRASRRPATL